MDVAAERARLGMGARSELDTTVSAADAANDEVKEDGQIMRRGRRHVQRLVRALP